MKGCLAMVQRDLLVLPRKKYFYWQRLLFGGILLFFLIFQFSRSSYTMKQSSSLGLEAFSIFSITAFVMIFLFAPAAAALTLSKDKESRNLELLLLTNLSSWDMVLAHFFSHFTNLLLLMLISLPMLLMCVNFGGISGKQILSIVLILAGFLALALSLGIFVATWTTSQRCVGWSFLLLTIYLLALTIGENFLRVSSSSLFTMKWNPFAALSEVLMQGSSPLRAFGNFLFQLVLSALLLMVSAKRLPDYALREIAPRRTLGSLLGWEKKPATCLPVSIIEGNPIAWRDYYKMYGGKKYRLLKILFCLGLFALIWGISKQFTASVTATFFILLFFFALNLLSYSTRAFVTEKEKKTWELLLTTDLTNREIVWGKLVAAFRASSLFLTLSSVFCFILFCLTVPEIQCLEVFFFAFYGVGLICAITLLSLYMSLRCKSINKASVFTFLIIIGWFWLSNVLYFSIFGAFFRTSSQTLALHFFLWGWIYFGIAFVLWVWTVGRVRKV